MLHEAVTLDELCTLIDETKPRRFSLTAAIRCYVVRYLMEAASSKAPPFEPLAPNGKTIEAMKAARRGEFTRVGAPGKLLTSLSAKR